MRGIERLVGCDGSCGGDRTVARMEGMEVWVREFRLEGFVDRDLEERIRIWIAGVGVM
jgi:hypothetical protein